jgi:hypothetical protein
LSWNFSVKRWCDACTLRRDAKNRRTARRDLGAGIAQAARLLGAARRVVHRVKIHHQFLSPKICKIDGAAIRRQGGKSGAGSPALRWVAIRNKFRA